MVHLPMFHGGWVGYFGYDTVRCVEPRLAQSCPEDTLGLPDIWLTLSEEVVVFDNLAGALTLVVNADAAVPDAYSARWTGSIRWRLGLRSRGRHSSPSH